MTIKDFLLFISSLLIKIWGRINRNHKLLTKMLTQKKSKRKVNI